MAIQASKIKSIEITCGFINYFEVLYGWQQKMNTFIVFSVSNFQFSRCIDVSLLLCLKPKTNLNKLFYVLLKLKFSKTQLYKMDTFAIRKRYQFNTGYNFKDSWTNNLLKIMKNQHNMLSTSIHQIFERGGRKFENEDQRKKKGLGTLRISPFFCPN